jgi:hypothetical protein
MFSAHRKISLPSHLMDSQHHDFKTSAALGFDSDGDKAFDAEAFNEPLPSDLVCGHQPDICLNDSSLRVFPHFTMTEPTRIIAIRHAGETSWNVDARIQGGIWIFPEELPTGVGRPNA